MKALVVDDSRAMRTIVARLVRSVPGIDEVLEADSAEAAADLLRTDPADLILCDWNMSGMTGLEFLKALREVGWTIPFGFVTSESSDEVVSSALAAGAQFLLAKPFGEDDLIQKVRAAMAGEEAGVTRGPSSRGNRVTALHGVLHGMVDRPVHVDPSEESPKKVLVRWAAEYRNEAGESVAMVIVEMPLACALAAAFMKMPAASAQEWVGVGTMPEILNESFHEVMNVLARVAYDGDERCILADVIGLAATEPPPNADRIASARSNDHFAVSIDGYGEGVLSLVTF